MVRWIDGWIDGYTRNPWTRTCERYPGVDKSYLIMRRTPPGQVPAHQVSVWKQELCLIFLFAEKYWFFQESSAAWTTRKAWWPRNELIEIYQNGPKSSRSWAAAIWLQLRRADFLVFSLFIFLCCFRFCFLVVLPRSVPRYIIYIVVSPSGFRTRRACQPIRTRRAGQCKYACYDDLGLVPIFKKNKNISKKYVIFIFSIQFLYIHYFEAIK